jgi:hypothetical protein
VTSWRSMRVSDGGLRPFAYVSIANGQDQKQSFS